VILPCCVWASSTMLLMLPFRSTKQQVNVFVAFCLKVFILAFCFLKTNRVSVIVSKSGLKPVLVNLS